MAFIPHGKHLIAGHKQGSDTVFDSQPAHGPTYQFAAGSSEFVEAAVSSAEEAFGSFSSIGNAARASFLEAIADEIEARADEITEIGCQETGLPTARLQGERGRTTGQLRLFAQHILNGTHLDQRNDPALPDRDPLPRPELTLIQRPIGPVAVFGASNFPLAFSTAGGDTAAAFAAGCPVVVKGHEAHPGTAEIVAEAINAAVASCDLHPGVFSLIQGGNRDVGAALVTHPLIQAVGFTGSLQAGRALFDLCARRPEPIPFFGELGSTNPMFLLNAALRDRGEDIANGWAASLTMGAGQFCTNPGIVFVKSGPDADKFAQMAIAALERQDAQTMLTDGIANAYSAGQHRMSNTAGVETLLMSPNAPREANAALYRTSASTFLSTPMLSEEVFGPLGLIVTVGSDVEMQNVARSLNGQLTCTLHMDDADLDMALRLIPTLERKAGRILVNGFPTGVEVADSMVHGGPYPASTNFGATSVGTLAIRRFLRPVCYQNVPSELLPQT